MRIPLPAPRNPQLTIFPGPRSSPRVGASGLVRGLVAYGEAWTLTAPSETRYAVGVSGSITDGLWTVEAGYGAALAGTLARLQPEVAPARLQVAGQVVRRLGGGLAVTGTARVFSDSDAYRGQTALEVTKTAGNAPYGIALMMLVGPEPTQGVVIASIRFAFQSPLGVPREGPRQEYCRAGL